MPNILSFAIKLRYELLIRTGTTAQDAGMTAQNEWNTHQAISLTFKWKLRCSDRNPTFRKNMDGRRLTTMICKL